MKANNIGLFMWSPEPITLAGGTRSNFKIECDALANGDWICLANLIAQRIAFGEVIGVPRGGLILAEKLLPFRHKDSTIRLVVDDVYTTGASLKNLMTRPDDLGFVVFARSKITHPDVQTLFQL